MDDTSLVYSMAEVFKALGDPTRLKLLGLLANRNSESFCVIELAEKLGMSQPAISQHLKVLKNIKLLEPHRKGFYVYYSINLDTLNMIKQNVGYLFDLAFQECSDEAWLRKKPE